MRADEFKRRKRATGADDKLKRGIAREAARRLFDKVAPEPGEFALREASRGEYEAAKKQAVAVLGHRVRPSDLPTDAEVRAEILELARCRNPTDPPETIEHAPEGAPAILGELVDRYVVFKLRLAPLANVKQDPKRHPEGDALYHSLQVFELARAARPYDDEFLFAALLHDVGKAIDPRDPIAAALTSLEGTISPRTAWLIEHQNALIKPVSPRTRADFSGHEWYEDLVLLRELDEQGRTPGIDVMDVDEAIEYLKEVEEDEDE